MVDEETLLIKRLIQGSSTPREVLGPGDDAAVIPMGEHDLVVTTDLVTEGVHFPAVADAGSVGRFAAAVSLSDLAAMGAEPIGFLAAYGCPRPDADSWLLAAANGLGTMLAEHGCPLLGGDTKESATRMITGTALGRVPSGGAVPRTGARAGDAVVVVGDIGGPGMAYTDWQEGRLDPLQAAVLMLEVTPRLAAGRLLREAGATAMIDLSDGLARAAALLSEASGVRVELDRGGLPYAPRVRVAMTDHERPDWDQVTTGIGGDYALLATMPADRADAARARLAAAGHQATVTGRVTGGAGAFLTGGDAEPVDLAMLGWRHFRAR